MPSIKSKSPSAQRERTHLDNLGRSTAKRETIIFETILMYAVKHFGHMPTLRTICEATAISSTSVVAGYIRRLIEKDKLRKLDGHLIIPGSRFEWHEHFDTGPVVEPSVPATEWTVDIDRDGNVGFPDRAGAGSLVPLRELARRMVQKP